MTINLEAALDAAAPDGGSWQSGQHAFFAAKANGSSDDDALHAALNAAAPDGGSWQLGEYVAKLSPNDLVAYQLGLHQTEVPPSKSKVLYERLKTNAKALLGKTKRSATNTAPAAKRQNCCTNWSGRRCWCCS